MPPGNRTWFALPEAADRAAAGEVFYGGPLIVRPGTGQVPRGALMVIDRASDHCQSPFRVRDGGPVHG